jgi:hypothetical protein
MMIFVKQHIEFVHQFYVCIKSIGLTPVLYSYSLSNFFSPFVLMHTAVGMIMCVCFLEGIDDTRRSSDFFASFFVNHQGNISMSNCCRQESEVSDLTFENARP